MAIDEFASELRRLAKSSAVEVMLLVVFSVGIASCSKKESEGALPRLPVVHPWRDQVEIQKQYVAQIRAIQHIELRAFEKGYLRETFVDEGQPVKKGQKMFQIMPVLMNAEYQRAQAEYETSKIEYENTKGLAKQKIVSKSELALAKAKFQKYAAEMSLAKAHLDLTTIEAPFDGIMGTFRVRLGSLVEEGEPLTTVSDISKLWVYFNFSEADYLAYQQNQKRDLQPTVGLMLANGQMHPYPGVIDTIGADFNNETGNIPFRASFANPDLLVRHGETGNIVLSKVVKSALLIPQKATYEVLDKRYVYVVAPGGVLEPRQVEIENEVPDLFLIRNGLTESDTILLEGHGKVKKGEKIDPNLVPGGAKIERGLAEKSE
jgi:membrane fusion protein, multidrug efflux system